MKNRIKLAIQNLIDGIASEEEVNFLRQELAASNISVGGNVDHSIVILGNGNNIEITSEALNRLNADSLLNNSNEQYQPLDVFVERYRQRIKELHSKIRILNKESVPLSSHYVDLSVVSGLSSKRHGNIYDLEMNFRKSRSFIKNENPTHLRDLISEKSKIFLSGKPGAGKTTSLKHITVLAAEGRIKKLPIFISLTDLASCSQSLMQYIIAQFELCEFPHADIFIKSILENGEAIVLFDGFDEVVEETGQREQLRKEIDLFTQKYSNNKFIISCRNAAINYQFNDFAYFEIADFDDNQTISYINNWFSNSRVTASTFIEQLQKPYHWNIKELTQNPLLLNLLCIVFEESKKIPSKKSDLYREAMDCLLQKWDESKDIKRDRIYQVLSLKNKRKLLAQLAFKFSNQRTIFFDQEKASSIIVEFFEDLGSKNGGDEIDGSVVLNAIEAQHGLITKRAEYIYSFSHLSFQEYFASRYVVETNTTSVLKKYFSHINDDSWEEIFFLTSGMQEKADVYFTKFLSVINSKVAQDEKIKHILEWADEKQQESYNNTHPALGRIIALRTVLNIDNVVDQVKPDISSKDYFVAEKLALFLHLDIKIDTEISTLAEIANCIALNKPLSKSLKSEFIKLLKLAEDRAFFYQDSDANKSDFSFEQARAKIRNYVLSLNHDTRQEFKVNLSGVWSDSMIRDFSNVLNINLSDISNEFINIERILASNRFPKWNASKNDWNSFRQGLKKDILGNNSLLYDLNLTDNQREKLILYLRANLLFAKCLHVSDTVDVTKFENLLIKTS